MYVVKRAGSHIAQIRPSESIKQGHSMEQPADIEMHFPQVLSYLSGRLPAALVCICEKCRHGVILQWLAKIILYLAFAVKSQVQQRRDL